MVEEKVATENDSIADILSRAFDSATMPKATAELILGARFPKADIDRVDQLLEKKRDHSLTADQQALLQEYLYADSLLTILQSKARRALGRAA